MACLVMYIWPSAADTVGSLGPQAAPAIDRDAATGFVSGVTGAIGDLVAGLETKGRGPKTGYEREKFGQAWTDDNDAALGHNGCDTRNDILKRDLASKTFKPKTRDCVVLTGTLTKDPYTGKRIDWKRGQDSSAIQIDHIIPLSYAWQMGAAQWPEDKRVMFANDPDNLMAVDGPTNSSKGDSGPASWLPPLKNYRCQYVTNFAQVAVKYQLPVTAADRNMIAAQC